LLENLKNPDFRLTVEAENCCLSVQLVVFIAMHYSLHMAIYDVAGGRVYHV